MFIKDFFKAILYRPLYNILMFLVFLMPAHSVGLAIIILTILVRLVLWPANAKALNAQKALRQHAPELEKIKQQHKGDAAAQSKATMEFYKRNNVNPLGGCLPLLVQLPILYILYRVFTSGLTTARFDLLYNFVPHVDVVNTAFLWLDLAKPDHLFILPVITGLVQFYQSKQISDAQGIGAGDDPAAKMSKQMLYLSPIFTIFISLRLPSALPLYWLITTIMSVIQQHLIFNSPVSASKGVTVSVRKKQS